MEKYFLLNINSPFICVIVRKYTYKITRKVQYLVVKQWDWLCYQEMFTKLMKPIYASRRQMGHSNSGYIDDSLLVSDTIDECLTNIKDTVSVMTMLVL